MRNFKLYEQLEYDKNVIYPMTDNATYKSKLNYSAEKSTTRQRWYRYKEGFSVELVKKLIYKYSGQNEGIIMDPFLGSGSTLLAANELGFRGIGFEVNPFSYFLSKCKLENYSEEDLDLLISVFPKLLLEAKYLEKNVTQRLPKLSIANKVFHGNIQNYYMTIKSLIKNCKATEKTKNLMLLIWLSGIEQVSQYRKAGNGLKRKTKKNSIITNLEDVDNILLEYHNSIIEDLIFDLGNYKCDIFNKSAFNLSKMVHKKSISGVVFSPPYANSFDYTEIYKLELWFGDFVDDYSDLKKLRNKSLRSHLNGLTKSFVDNEDQIFKSTEELDDLITMLETKSLWNKYIPYMLKKYFSEMFCLLLDIFNSLENNGFCAIVVGNSSYGGIVFPADLLIADYAEKIGFQLEGIYIDRYIITSSQQYELTLEDRKYLRESIVCLKKPQF